MAGDPLYINASAGAPSYSANELRQGMALALQYNGRTLGARQGVRPGGNGLQTSVAGSTITVRAGCGCVDPALTTAQGPYWVALPADETHTLTAAHATLPRKDITVLRVYDHDEDSSGLRTARSEYLVGTAAASPSEPAVPAGAFRLATIDVPAQGGGSPAVTNNFPFTVATGGVLPVRSVTERGLITPYDGMVIERMDRNPRWLELYDGTAWRVITDAVCSSTSDRDTAITNPYNGQLAMIQSSGQMYRHTGSAWTAHQQYRDAIVLGADAASITFSSIPASLKTVQVEWTARSTAAVVNLDMHMRINGSSAASYSHLISYQVNTTYSNFSNTGIAQATVGAMLAANAGANNFASGYIHFPGWSASPGRLTWTNRSFYIETLAASAFGDGGGMFFVAGPYTSITLFPSSGNFLTGSQFTLYGWE